MNRHFSKKDKQVANWCMTRCSNSLAVNDMQIKATMRYDLTPGRMAVTKKTTNNKCRHGCEEKEILVYCW